MKVNITIVPSVSDTMNVAFTSDVETMMVSFQFNSLVKQVEITGLPTFSGIFYALRMQKSKFVDVMINIYKVWKSTKYSHNWHFDGKSYKLERENIDKSGLTNFRNFF
jgi:hypothetical protein